MADKPIYYGGQSVTPTSRKRGPMYYGASHQYGQYGQYGSYGAYGMPGAPANEEGSVVGTLSIGRILRVVSQRWLSIFVFLLVGLIVSFTCYKISPTIYEAKSEFTMDTRRNSGRGNSAIELQMPDLGSDYSEIFNTRLSTWRSEKIIAKIIESYRTNFPASVVSEEEITGCLAGSVLELQRNSRIITITVRSTSPALAAALANAYAAAIEALTDEENKARCDKAVALLHANVEKQRRDVEKVSKDLLDFRTVHKVDALRSARETAQQALSKTTGDILLLEAEETQLVEWEKMLALVQQDPKNYGSLSTGIPRAQEIATEYATFQAASAAYEQLQVAYTESHPEVVAKAREKEMAKQRFLDAAARALQTGRSTLQVTRNQLANLRVKRDDLTSELASLSQRILLAESGLGILEADFGVANRVLEDLIMQENKARNDAEANNEIITLGRRANEPRTPVLPNPMLIFGVGILLSLGLGFLFVLILDNYEDTIINLADIEGRLALRVLAIFPHVRRKKREEVAKFVYQEKYSQFSEAVAGFRNLLDSPRYEALSHCMLVISTQPGEGKTITSTSLAIAYAQIGKKVLHVDFDLRRPRLARVWGLKLTSETSFSHALQNAMVVTPDFEKLIHHTDVPNLDAIASLPPEGVSPSTIFGSRAVADFFVWAREHYDYIIVDSPPYGIVGDVVSLAVMVDSVIIMCCPDRTHFKPIQHCSRTLTEAGATILGVVVNDVDTDSASAFSNAGHHRYGYGYSGYGYGYGYGPRKGKKEATQPNGEKAPEKSHVEFTDDE